MKKPFFTFLQNYKYKIIREAVEKLNMDNPLESEMDEEWNPLLQKLHKQNIVKAELETMRREFSANVSHELKTPLTSISGYSELLASGMVQGEYVEDFAEKIYMESQRLLNLIEDVIRISKLDERGLEMEKEEVDLFALTRDICSRLSYAIEQKDIKLKLTGKSVNFLGVKSVLDEMLYNICENGVKYNVEGGTLEIWVGTSLQGPKVMVTDTGIGIPVSEQQRVFERFYRVDKSHCKENNINTENLEVASFNEQDSKKITDVGGTGLGLSIVKNSAKIHGAHLDLQSTLGIGTKITIIFPIKINC